MVPSVRRAQHCPQGASKARVVTRGCCNTVFMGITQNQLPRDRFAAMPQYRRSIGLRGLSAVTSKSFGLHLRFSHLGGHMLALFSFAFVSFASLPSCPDNSISDPPIPGVLQGKGSGQGHILLAMVRHGKMPSPTMQSHQCSLTTACTPPSARRHPTTTRIRNGQIPSQ